MAIYRPPAGYSYDLDDGMLKVVGEEFAAEKVAHRFADAIGDRRGKTEVDKIGRQVFEDYGRRWARRTLELGEQYSDSTYLVMKNAIEHTGYMYWPLVPQRFVEIAYLAVMSFLELDVAQDNAQALAYCIAQCDIYNSLKDKTGAEVADLLPCRHGCLTLLKTLVEGLDIAGTKVEMEAAIPKEGYCRFAAIET